MCSGRSDWALPQPGFPIRRSTDQSLVDSSPWLFAATHVLHRHLAPRHPPLALHSLKSHGPRAFDREENPLEHRGPQRVSKTLVLAMQFSKFQPRRFPSLWARLAGGGMRGPEQSSTEPAPVLPIEQGRPLDPKAGRTVGTAAWRPLPQNRAVKAGRHDASVE